MKKARSISIIVPCYNEEKIVYQNLLKIINYLKNHFDSFEIIAVNDGSTDKTLNELKKLQSVFPIRILNFERNEGKGRAVKEGILMSEKEIVGFIDADLPVSIEELEKFLIEIENGYDVVVASRFLPQSKVAIPVKWYRRLMEKAFRILRFLILNEYEIKDTQCGFKVFKKEVAKKIFFLSRIKRFAFEAEIILIAKELGYKIKEVPIILKNPQTSHVKLWKDPPNMFLDLIKIKINKILKKYKT